VGRGWTALWAAVAVLLAGVLPVVAGLAVGAVPVVEVGTRRRPAVGGGRRGDRGLGWSPGCCSPPLRGEDERPSQLEESNCAASNGPPCIRGMSGAAVSKAPR